MLLKNSEYINTQAREWFTLMQSGSATEKDKQGLADWLAEDIAHTQAYTEYEMIWNDLEQLRYSEDYRRLRQTESTHVFSGLIERLKNIFASPLQMGLAISATAIVIIGAKFALTTPNPALQIEEFATQLGNTRELSLADGSTINLGAQSKVRVWFSDNERHVDLLEGQAFFIVSKNPNKPFIVAAGNTRVRVVGTQFDIRLNSNTTRVAVAEGIVAVSDLNEDINKPQTILTANQQISENKRRQFTAVQSITPTELEAWRKGRLMYLNANLADVIADLNRYQSPHIVLASERLASLKVTASVSLDQAATLPHLLESSLPIKLQQNESNQWIVSEK